jgi:hypothetical protein
MAKKRNTTSWQTIVVVVLVAAMLIGLIGISFFSGGSITRQSLTTRQVALACTTDMATTFHIHPSLEINISGENMTIPANIGVSPTCMNSLHTHDDTGLIHVEAPEKRDFTLADFFAVWNKEFSRNQILDAKVDANTEIVMTVNGTPSNEYENLVLKDGDKIVISYQKKGAAVNIPFSDIKVNGVPVR